MGAREGIGMKKLTNFTLILCFLYALKTSENHEFSDVFGESRMVSLAWNGLTRFCTSSGHLKILSIPTKSVKKNQQIEPYELTRYCH